MQNPLWPLITSFSWQELRQHPWRNAAAVVSVMLGVALAFAVHVINASALDEFAQAVRSVSGQADLSLSSTNGSRMDETLYGRLVHHPDVAWASPVLEIDSYTLGAGDDQGARAQSAPYKVALRVLGVDALQVAAIAPDLLPVPGTGADRLDVFAPNAVFLNPSARAALLHPGSDRLDVQHGMRWQRLRVAGTVTASGTPLAVMDVAAAQAAFGAQGQLSRVDLRLRPGVDREAFARALLARSDWPTGAVLQPPGDALSRMGNVSRAYRVNLTVLALVALFTGGFLVYSVLALSVTRRAQPLALLGVLGLDPRQRWVLILLEAASLGLVGSVLGIALGTGLAWLALQLLGGDLGGGYFSGSTPQLQWSVAHALLFGALGIVAALVGAWWPARMAAQMAPAQTLKGLGLADQSASHAGAGAALLLLGGALALMPPVGGIPLAAYLSVALVLLGGIAALPWMVGVLLNAVAPWVAQRPLALLAVERARRMRSGAAIAVSGVVASLSLAVALTVMVAMAGHGVAGGALRAQRRQRQQQRARLFRPRFDTRNRPTAGCTAGERAAQHRPHARPRAALGDSAGAALARSGRDGQHAHRGGPAAGGRGLASAAWPDRGLCQRGHGRFVWRPRGAGICAPRHGFANPDATRLAQRPPVFCGRHVA